MTIYLLFFRFIYIYINIGLSPPPLIQYNKNFGRFLFFIIRGEAILLSCQKREEDPIEQACERQKRKERQEKRLLLPRPTPRPFQIGNHLFNQLGVPPCNLHTPWKNRIKTERGTLSLNPLHRTILEFTTQKEGTQPERKVEPKEGFFDSIERCERVI